MLRPEQLEEAARLLRAARSDLRAATLLAADVEQEDDVVGFHAQQATWASRSPSRPWLVVTSLTGKLCTQRCSLPLLPRTASCGSRSRLAHLPERPCGIGPGNERLPGRCRYRFRGPTS